MAINTDLSGEYGAWKIEGETEASVLSKITGKRIFKKDFLRFYHPDLADLRRRFPTAIIVLFAP